MPVTSARTYFMRGAPLTESCQTEGSSLEWAPIGLVDGMRCEADSASEKAINHATSG